MRHFNSKITTSAMALKQRHKTDEMVTNNMKMGGNCDSNKEIANTALQAVAILDTITSKKIYVLATQLAAKVTNLATCVQLSCAWISFRQNMKY